jgi:integrase
VRPPALSTLFFPTPYGDGKPKLLDRVHAVARLRHLSLGTERACSGWVRRFIRFHKKRRPGEVGAEEMRLFLSHLAGDGKVAASAQNVALCALLFLYRGVLGVELPYAEGIRRAKRPARAPVVFSRGEVSSLMSHLTGAYPLIAGLLYGSGPRLMEALRLRVKDLDFDRRPCRLAAGTPSETAPNTTRM